MLFLLLTLLMACSADPFDTRELSAQQKSIMKQFEGEWRAATPNVRFQAAEAIVGRLDVDLAYDNLQKDGLEINKKHFGWLIEFLERDNMHFIKGVSVEGNLVSGIFACWLQAAPTKDATMLKKVLDIFKPQNPDNFVRVKINFKAKKYEMLTGDGNVGSEQVLTDDHVAALSEELFEGDNSEKQFDVSEEEVIASTYKLNHKIGLFKASPSPERENMLVNTSNVRPLSTSDENFKLWILTDEAIMQTRKKIVRSYSLTKEYQLVKTYTGLTFVCFYRIRQGDHDIKFEAYTCQLNK